MARFVYSAIDSKGKEKQGKIEAASLDEARSKVAAEGLMVTQIQQDAGGKTSKSKATKASGPKKQKKVSTSGKVINEEGLAAFTRQMATLLQSGLPLLRSLEVMIRQEKNPRFKAVLIAIADNVRSGNPFSEGLLQFPKIFDKLYINMVKAGEAGGVLDVVLSRLARFKEKSLKTKKKIKSAMIYPSVVIFIAVTIVIFLMSFIVPRFKAIFEDMLGGASLPWLTQVVVGISDFIKGYVWLCIFGTIAFFVFFSFFKNTAIGRRFFDGLALSIPKVNVMVQMANISRFTRTFGTLLSSGVPILQALNITKEIVGNSYFTQALGRVHDRVRDGEALAPPVDREKVFPTVVSSMIEVGEETGELPEMLNRIADNYDEDLDNAVAGITSIIEPIMIVFLALVVGTIVIALFLPVIEIIKNLTG